MLAKEVFLTMQVLFVDQLLALKAQDVGLSLTRVSPVVEPQSRLTSGLKAQASTGRQAPPLHRSAVPISE
jgi:hypothetical protein